MKCSKCNAELPEQAKVCPECQTPVGKKNGKVIGIAVAAAAVVCVAAAAFVKFGMEDPKETVIHAFENIYQEDQVSPVEELFGLEALAEAAAAGDYEGGLTLKLDGSSDEMVNTYAGSGLSFEGKNSVTEKKTLFDLGLIYGGMDAANLYIYGDDTRLMAAAPQLSGKVFTLDVSEGLADRIKASPVFGPYLEQNGVDIDGLASYYTELAEKENGDLFDLKALYERYKEGSKAQENFKAALTVEKGEKGTFLVDGKETSCRGYQVAVSKVAMIDFLRTSSDFFLQDETLKGDYLKQLEAMTRMTELMGSYGTGQELSAQEQLDQTYEEVETAVDQMITELETALNDIQLKVYVTNDGRLASVEGTTVLNGAAYGAESDVQVDGNWQLQGGTYLTQNMMGSLMLTQGESVTRLEFIKQGTYDGKQLTADVSVDAVLPDQTSFNGMFTGTYTAEDGAYHVSLEGGMNGVQAVKLDMTGAVDELEKGSNIHVALDSLTVVVPDANMEELTTTLSGEYYLQPLSGAIEAPQGEAFDVLAATEEDWNSVLFELLFGAIGLAGQLEGGN